MTFRLFCAFPIYVIARNKRMLTSRQSTFQPLKNWETFWHLIFEPICLHKLLDDYKYSFISNRGYRELLHGRLCRPDSEERPLVSNFTNVAIVKLCCHNFTHIANVMIFLCLLFLIDLLTSGGIYPGTFPIFKSRDFWTSLVPGQRDHGTFKVSRSCPV